MEFFGFMHLVAGCGQNALGFHTESIPTLLASIAFFLAAKSTFCYYSPTPKEQAK
jgi:hypothetical protein